MEKLKIGAVEGREVWGSTFALFYCADVALGYCSMERCSSTFLSLLPLRAVFPRFPPSFSLFIFPQAPIIFPSIISPRLLLPCSVFSLCVSSKLCLVRHARLPFLYTFFFCSFSTVQKFKTIILSLRQPISEMIVIGFPAAQRYKKQKKKKWFRCRKRGRNNNPSCEQSSHKV